MCEYRVCASHGSRRWGGWNQRLRQRTGFGLDTGQRGSTCGHRWFCWGSRHLGFAGALPGTQAVKETQNFSLDWVFGQRPAIPAPLAFCAEERHRLFLKGGKGEGGRDVLEGRDGGGGEGGV